ncbi:MAG TPA: 50S ribosomal protein L22 [Pirellulaceae bacterium]|nr:50S ribosomal protein L22 [Pirellulaceae bacterium]HMO92200.1 50S ribosomal protein L22 [Pirellulaceae bacterium]HMP68873.1 50S ribosomal protein L22 [Pirellulaceae bacterium]
MSDKDKTTFLAKHRFARISPRKVRPLAQLVRGKFVDDALHILKYQPHRGARLLEKVIESAMANARDPDQNPGRILEAKDLYIKQIKVDGGPMFKRVRPRARGMAFMIKKRMSHIEVEVEQL